MTKEKKKKIKKIGGVTSESDKLDLLLKKYTDNQKKTQDLEKKNKYNNDSTGTYIARRTIFWIGIICICLGVLVLIYGIFRYMGMVFGQDQGDMSDALYNQNKIPSLMWKIVLGSSLMGVGLWMSFDLARHADL